MLLHLQVSLLASICRRRAGAEQIQADTNVAAASSGEFAGIKLSERAGAEQVQAVDHRCENLHDKEVQVGQSLSDIVQTLLACLDQCVQQSELFKLVLHSIPLAVEAAIHAGTLRSLAASVGTVEEATFGCVGSGGAAWE